MSAMRRLEDAVLDNNERYLDAVARELARDHAEAFTALDVWTRIAVAATFHGALLRSVAEGQDAAGAYSDAYFETYGPLTDRLDAMRTGGADWCVDEAYAIHANRDMEGLFLLRDGEYGSWSVVHRLHDEDGNAEIVDLVCDDDWPVVVNEALRLRAEHAHA